jgi:GNAT superfamily N-acetyltransferase
MTMTRKIVRLTPEHLEALDAPCRSCLFWERDPVSRGRVPGEDAAAADKRAWVAEVQREWGTCGQVALVDGRPVGYLVYAPEAFVPGAAAIPTAPVSPDAVLLTTAYVDPAHAGGGLARTMVQRMARDLVQREVRAVEAFGFTSAGNGHGGAGRGCLLPVEFLAGVGFGTQRDHPSTPRMRMDLRTTVTWKRPVAAALERLSAAVRPAPKTTRAQRTATRPPAPGAGSSVS